MPPSSSPPHDRLVLLVDDFEDALEIYQSYLTFQGYRIVVARSGADVLAMVRAERPAIILMDLQMGGLTGTETMQILRADRAYDDVHIVAFTAHALEEQRREALAAGFDEVISKPCMPDTLALVIDRLLGSARSGQGS